jgi:hypothetical protein
VALLVHVLAAEAAAAAEVILVVKLRSQLLAGQAEMGTALLAEAHLPVQRVVQMLVQVAQAAVQVLLVLLVLLVLSALRVTVVRAVQRAQRVLLVARVLLGLSEHIFQVTQT